MSSRYLQMPSENRTGFADPVPPNCPFKLVDIDYQNWPEWYKMEVKIESKYITSEDFDGIFRYCFREGDYIKITRLPTDFQFMGDLYGDNRDKKKYFVKPLPFTVPTNDLPEVSD